MTLGSFTCFDGLREQLTETNASDYLKHFVTNFRTATKAYLDMAS
jgi:hypothetical protein